MTKIELQLLQEVTDNRKFDCTCGQELKADEWEGWDYAHDGGVDTPEGPRWLYITCNKCDYQWAFWKILRRLKNR